MNLLDFLKQTKTKELIKEEKKPAKPYDQWTKEDVHEGYGWYGQKWNKRACLIILRFPNSPRKGLDIIEFNSDGIHILNLLRLGKRERTIDSLLKYIGRINKDMTEGLSGFQVTMMERYLDIWSAFGVVEHVTRAGSNRGRYANSVIQVEGVPQGDRLYRFIPNKAKKVEVLGIKRTKNKTVKDGIRFWEVSILAGMHATLGGVTDVPETEERAIEEFYPSIS